MIPLMRPMVPRLKEIEPYLKKSQASGLFTNFGPVWWEATRRLGQMTERHALPVANATVALELALRVRFAPLGIKRVLVPDFTHAATLLAVARAGMEPVLCRVRRETWTIDLELAAANMSEFEGMIAVAPFGYHLDFSSINEFSEKYGIEVIYDLAGAWGMPLHECTGPAVFSFHATKTFSCGEGGVVCFDNEEEWERARRLSNFDTMNDRFIASTEGSNYKIDEFKSAMICHILDRHAEVKHRIEHRRQLISYYQDELHGLVSQDKLHAHPYASPSLCVIGGFHAPRFLEARAAEKGVTLRRYYIPLSEMPGINNVSRIGESDRFFQSCIALPSDATDDELDRVIECVRELL